MAKKTKTEGKIAILITAFMRDELLYETVRKLLKNWNDRYYVIIGSQDDCGYEDEIRRKLAGKGIWVYLPYDCGLSYARNELVKKAHHLGFEYCWLGADSLQFTEVYDVEPCLDFMNKHDDCGIIGFHLDNSKGEWYGDLDLIPNKFFEISEAKRPSVGDFQPVDIVKNFFLARTQTLVDNPWDNNLKLAEHESFVWELKKNTDWKVFYYPKIVGHHVHERSDGEYAKLRNRCYREYVNRLKKKYNISGWVRNTIPRK